MVLEILLLLLEAAALFVELFNEFPLELFISGNIHGFDELFVKLFVGLFIRGTRTLSPKKVISL